MESPTRDELVFVCPQCQIENRTNAKFCRKCGQPRVELEKNVATITLPAEKKQTGNGSAEAHLPSDAIESTKTPETRPNVLREQPEPIVTISQGPVGPSGEVHVQTEEPAAPECPTCWTVLRVTDKFCCWCGSPQPNRLLPYHKLCLTCNTQLPEKANFCFSCGADMASSSRLKVRVPLELFKDEDSEFFPRFDA